MKNIDRLFVLLLIIGFSLFNINVNAAEFSIDTLIPVNEEATVVSDTFIYSGIKFQNDSNNVVNGKIKIDSITNNTSKRIPPSIEILLFDSNMKNIGYITYCASKDYGSDNSFVEISANSSLPFEFNVSSKYFGADEKKDGEVVADSSQIAYYAVHGDNKYCQIGGYSKYLGFTIEEITGGGVYEREFKMSDWILYLPYFLIALVALIGYGLLLNSVYKRMHARTSILSYLPLTNFYIAVKLAFGKKIAWVSYILSIVSFYIVYNYSSMTFTWILLVFVAISTVIDLIKLITGKYDLFIIGEKHYKTEEGLDGVFASHSGSRFIEESDKEKHEENPVTANAFLDSINNGINDQNLSNDNNTLDYNDVVDISYDTNQPLIDDGFVADNNSNMINNFDVNENNTLTNDSFGNSPSVLTPVSNVSSSSTNEEEKNDLNSIYGSNNSAEPNIPKLDEGEITGESELSNFFR